jgi:hypothetical protein
MLLPLARAVFLLLQAEQSRAVAYCRQLASTVTHGIEPRWDPWPCICSMSRLVSFSCFRCSSLLITREGLDFFVIGQVKVKVTLRLTVSQSVSLGVEPHLRLMTRYLLLFDSYGLVFLWGALSDERTDIIGIPLLQLIPSEMEVEVVSYKPSARTTWKNSSILVEACFQCSCLATSLDAYRYNNGLHIAVTSGGRCLPTVAWKR